MPNTWIKKTTRASKVYSHKIIEGENHHEVAAVSRKADEAEEAKNAALIAAAPELLEALRKMAARCELDYIQHYEQEINNSEGDQYLQELEAARTAIAKATA